MAKHEVNSPELPSFLEIHSRRLRRWIQSTKKVEKTKARIRAIARRERNYGRTPATSEAPLGIQVVGRRSEDDATAHAVGIGMGMASGILNVLNSLQEYFLSSKQKTTWPKNCNG